MSQSSQIFKTTMNFMEIDRKIQTTAPWSLFNQIRYCKNLELDLARILDKADALDLLLFISYVVRNLRGVGNFRFLSTKEALECCQFLSIIEITDNWVSTIGETSYWKALPSITRKEEKEEDELDAMIPQFLNYFNISTLKIYFAYHQTLDFVWEKLVESNVQVVLNETREWEYFKRIVSNVSSESLPSNFSTPALGIHFEYYFQLCSANAQSPFETNPYSFLTGILLNSNEIIEKDDEAQQLYQFFTETLHESYRKTYLTGMYNQVILSKTSTFKEQAFFRRKISENRYSISMLAYDERDGLGNGLHGDKHLWFYVKHFEK
ncbi:unnamed protein product, partial [Mesorhabditis belari]|uniref:Uncharacterized protein n=1 Tax=Mesorhabditis belari TaxID=2138241 RepID=A0AAF3FIE5_9BILA